MAITETALNAHVKPPESLKAVFKRWQKAKTSEIETNDDLRNLPLRSIEHSIDGELLASAEEDFCLEVVFEKDECIQAYEVTSCPGLILLPNLLSPDLQGSLLDKLLHRDLSNPEHLTNVHMFHHMQYPRPIAERTGSMNSMFGMDPNTQLEAKDPSTHKAMTIEQLLRRKLRWITLGGQYDWTNKVYPDEVPPSFPADIANMLKAYFPQVDAQAAIVNLYTPGDILAMHRDVSEECDIGLISISVGCDALFVVGNEDGTSHATIRLRSGDAVLMSGPSRYAWHGVPKIIPDTCPEYLADWPAQYPHWKGWLASKRINLNVRQMKE